MLSPALSTARPVAAPMASAAAPVAGAPRIQTSAAVPPDTLLNLVLNAPRLRTVAAGLLDTIGGRLSGTAAGDRTEAWAAAWLGSFGFDSVWLEPVRMPVWRREGVEVVVVGPELLAGRLLVADAFGYSPGGRLDSVRVLDIGRGAAGSIRPRMRGAALLTDVVSPEIVRAAAEAGVAALLRTSSEPGRLPRARVAPTAEAPAPLPILSLAFEDGLWLRRQRAAGPVTLRITVRAETVEGEASNVVAELRGSDLTARDQAFLLGAHLDAWDLGDGAIDNGTGVLTVMAVAAGLAALDRRPRRTVRVVLFAAEELGLRGSREYVRAHRDRLGELVAMMNLDMVGAPQGYGATGHAEADSVFARLAEMPLLRELGLSPEVEHGGGAGSDHQPFLLAGVPTIYVRTSLPPEALRWYHNAGDTYDKIDLDAVRASAAAAAAVVWTLADHPGRPLRHLGRAETRELIERLGW